VADRARAELREIDAKLDVAARRPHSQPAPADAHVIAFSRESRIDDEGKDRP
jgi:hypothetical protein